MTPETMAPPEAVLKYEIDGPRYTAVELIRDLAVPGQSVQILPRDNRHNLGPMFLTVRVRVAGTPGPNGRWRRFYIHPSGFMIEGGKGGAQMFDGRRPSLVQQIPPINGSAPAAITKLHHPLTRGNHFGTARSIKVAAQIVDGLSRTPLA